MPNDPPPAIISCDRHGRQPWHLICVHLYDCLPPARWVKVGLAADDNREIDADWICDACFQTAERDPVDNSLKLDINLLQAVCMGCCNQIKQESGFVRDDDGNLVRPSDLDNDRPEHGTDPG